MTANQSLNCLEKGYRVANAHRTTNTATLIIPIHGKPARAIAGSDF